MQIYLYLAYRSLLRSKTSLVLLLLAVTAGVAFQLPNGANLRGYSAELVRQGVARSTGHVLVTPPGAKPLSDVRQTLQTLRKQPFVRGATARLIRAGVVFRDEQYFALRAVGVDAPNEHRAAGFCEQVARGDCLSSRTGEYALVGHSLAEKLSLEVGQKVKLTLPYEEGGELRFASVRLVIRGVMRGTGGFAADSNLYLPMDELGYLVRVKDRASQLSVFVDDHHQSAVYSPAIAKLLPDARVTSWLDANGFVASAIKGNNTLFLISMTMVVFAVGIPVLALLMIHVLHERKQIATLAALGFDRRDLFLIYLLQAICVGALGALVGVLFGLGFCMIFESYPIFSYRDFTIRPALNALVILGPPLALFGVTVLAGLVPAIQASRADPCMELRER